MMYLMLIIFFYGLFNFKSSFRTLPALTGTRHYTTSTAAPPHLHYTVLRWRPSTRRTPCPSGCAIARATISHPPPTLPHLHRTPHPPPCSNPLTPAPYGVPQWRPNGFPWRTARTHTLPAAPGGVSPSHVRPSGGAHARGRRVAARAAWWQ